MRATPEGRFAADGRPVSASALQAFAALRTRLGAAVIGQPAVVEALLIVTLVIFLFMGSFRAVIIPVIAMPLTNARCANA